MKLIAKCKLVLFPNRYYADAIRKTKKAYRHDYNNSKNEDKNEIEYMEQSEVSLLNDEWDDYRSDKMLKNAKKYDVYIPPAFIDDKPSGYWESSTNLGSYFLNAKGRSLIKEEIRNERKWKIDTFTTIITLLLGLIGTLTGFFSIILRK